MSKFRILIARHYSDAALVEGVFEKDKVMERALFRHCKVYYEEKYSSMFFDGEYGKDDVFQETLITLWDIIKTQRIYVKDDVLYGKNNKPLTCSLNTFFMGIARLKFLEQSRNDNKGKDREEVEKAVLEALYGVDDENEIDVYNVKCGIVADCLSLLKDRCRQILEMFYIEEKTYEEMMPLFPMYHTEQALRNRKYHCMEELRESVKRIYEEYHFTA